MSESERNQRPVSFASRKLKDEEQRYHINEQEMLALLWALKKFRPFLFGHKFTIHTDCNVVKWLWTKRDVEGTLKKIHCDIQTEEDSARGPHNQTISYLAQLS